MTKTTYLRVDFLLILMLYTLSGLENKLGLGINYNGSILFGNSNSYNDIGIFGLNFYGIKAKYHFLKNKITPFISLSTGLSNLSTPEITDENDTNITEGESEFAFGLRPEIGTNLGNFIISSGYILPMKYRKFGQKAGVFQLSIGFRHKTL